MSKQPQISPERKNLYNLGGIVMAAGFLLFLSNFVVMPLQASRHPFDMSYNPMAGFAFRAVGGFLMIMAGAFMRSVAARGAAGSGLVLDPQQAREDLKPWAQTAGGLVKDALQEVRSGEAAVAPEVQTVVKVRCPQCKTLNDEDAKFCKSCAAPL